MREILTWTRQSDRTPSSAASASIPFISSSSSRPTYSPTSSRWESPLRNSAKILRKSRGGSVTLAPTLPCDEKENDVRERYRERETKIFSSVRFLCDARYDNSLVVYHGERSETTTVRRCGWVGRSLAAKARWRCASAAAAGQLRRTVRPSPRAHARRGQSITWREPCGFKRRVRRTRSIGNFRNWIN